MEPRKPVADPRGYISIDLSKGGIQSDIADLELRENILIGGGRINVDSLPSGLTHRVDLGVVTPDWLEASVVHRWPLPPFRKFTLQSGQLDSASEANAFADGPRPVKTPAGDYLLPVTAGDYQYGARPLELKLNDIFLYRSKDLGRTWSTPVKVPQEYNHLGWTLMAPKHSFGGKRIYTFFTYPTPGDFERFENAGIAFRYSEDDGRTWSPAERICPVNDPDFRGMWIMTATETASGAWMIAPHTGDWTKKTPVSPVQTELYVMRTEDQGKTWTLLPDKRPNGWQYAPANRMDEGRPIWLHDQKVAMFTRTQQGHIWRLVSEDDGKTWSEPAATSLVHPDAPPMVEKSCDGKRLYAFHHNRDSGEAFNLEDRSELWLSISEDDGDTWSEPRFVMVNATHNTRLMFNQEHHTISYAGLLVDNGEINIFIPHVWRQILHVRLKETDIDRLLTRREIEAQWDRANYVPVGEGVSSRKSFEVS